MISSVSYTNNDNFSKIVFMKYFPYNIDLSVGKINKNCCVLCFQLCTLLIVTRRKSSVRIFTDASMHSSKMSVEWRYYSLTHYLSTDFTYSIKTLFCWGLILDTPITAYLNEKLPYHLRSYLKVALNTSVLDVGRVLHIRRVLYDSLSMFHLL